MANNYLLLKKFCILAGADLFGVADIEGVKNEFMLSDGNLKKINRAVCLAVSLSEGVLQEIKDAPNQLYFYHYKTANVFLDQLVFKTAGFIQKKGFLAIPIPASQIVDWQLQKAHLSHKKIGHLAGLGWIGRNNLLVNKKLGSQFRLATILTDMPLKIDKPVKDDCSSCRLCVQLCPAGAIKNSPADFDHIGCFEKLKEFQKHRQVDQYICGVCINACAPKKHK
jgi:epoxyqueuosine reductase